MPYYLTLTTHVQVVSTHMDDMVSIRYNPKIGHDLDLKFSH